MRSTSRRRTRRGRVVVAIMVAVIALLPGAPAGTSPPGSTFDVAALSDPDAYPARGFFDIKGVTSFFHTANADELLPTMGIGRLDTEWALVEPQRLPPPCQTGYVEYDGRCFKVNATQDNTIRRFTEAGLPVMAIAFGTPEWARGDKPCDPFNAWHDVFCTPADPADFARFVGFLADRYDGTNGVGRITDFVIQNEVNLNQWYNIGCGKGIPCDFDAWVADYAELYNQAYDAIRAHQPRAKVMIPLTQHFEQSLDAPDATHPMYSVKTFLPPVAALLGDREWSIAHHPYPRSVDPRIDGRDLPYATMGNVGVLSGWLRATFPDDPHAWEVELTEQGMNNPGLFDELQVRSLCDAFRGVLGTPGIRSFLYHRIQDVLGEFGLFLGLQDVDGNPKPALATWRDANDPDDPSCGFENFPNTIVRTGIDADGRRWTSSRPLPRGYVMQDRQWRLLYEEAPGTSMAYECGIGPDALDPDATFLWPEADCDGAYPMGPVGWIDTASSPATTVVRTCGTGLGRTTVEGACSGPGPSRIVGYVVAEATPPEALALGDPPELPTGTTTTTTTTAPEPPGEHDVAFTLEEGSFRIGGLTPLDLPDGDPPEEGRTTLSGTWDEDTGELDVTIQVPTFTALVQTTLLPDPIPTTMIVTQVGDAVGSLDPVTGEMRLTVVLNTRLTSPDPLFAQFLGETCNIGPVTLELTGTDGFDLTVDDPVATLTASGFTFPEADGCGYQGDLDATLNPALGLPTDDTDATMTLRLLRDAPPPTTSTTTTSTSTTTTTTDPGPTTDPEPTDPTEPEPTDPTDPEPTDPTDPRPTDPTPPGVRPTSEPRSPLPVPRGPSSPPATPVPARARFTG